MITDVQLAIFANVLGVSLFLLVVLYHYVAVNNPKKADWSYLKQHITHHLISSW